MKNENPKISIILATLGNRVDELERLFHSITEQIYRKIEIVVIHQGSLPKFDYYQLVKSEAIEMKIIYSDVKGLSHARNLGIQYATGDILTFSDDDCWYPDKLFNQIVGRFREGIGVLCINMFDPDKNKFIRKQNSELFHAMKKRELLSRSSSEIFVSKDLILNHSILFDEEFGLGTKFPSGEENIFLFDIKYQGEDIFFDPHLLVFHKKKNIGTRLTKQQVISKGPLFKRIYGSPLAYVYILLFFIKKIKVIQFDTKMLLELLQQTYLYKQKGV